MADGRNPFPLTSRDEPKMRTDGRCVQCLKLRRKPAKGHKTALAEWARDPFCSTDCAKLYFGTRVEKDNGWQAEAQRELAHLDAGFGAVA